MDGFRDFVVSFKLTIGIVLFLVVFGLIYAVAHAEPAPPMQKNVWIQMGPRFPDGKSGLTSAVWSGNDWVPCRDCGHLVHVHTTKGDGYKLVLPPTETVLKADYKYERRNGSFIDPPWDGNGIIYVKKSGFARLDFINVEVYDSAPPNPESVLMEYGLSWKTQQVTTETFAGLNTGVSDCDICGGLVVADAGSHKRAFLYATFALSSEVTLINGTVHRYVVGGGLVYRPIDKKGRLMKDGLPWTTGWTGNNVRIYRRINGVNMMLKNAWLGVADAKWHSLPFHGGCDPDTGICEPSAAVMQ